MNNVDAAVPPNEAPEMWHVQLASGELCVMTLDQLDEAFQSGVINELTHVLQAGGTVWSKLGDIAGIEEDEAAPAADPLAPVPEAPQVQAAAAPAAAPEADPAIALDRAVILPGVIEPSTDSVTAVSAPAAMAAEAPADAPAPTVAAPVTGETGDEEIGYIPQLPRLGATPAPASVAAAAPPPAAAREEDEEIGYIPQLPRITAAAVASPVKAEEEIGYIPQLPRIVAYPVAAAAPVVAAPVVSVPPVAFAAPVAFVAAPAPVVAAPAPYEQPFSSSMPSVRPFVADVDLDDVPAPFRRSRKRGFMMAAVAVTLLGGVGVAAVNLGGGMSAPSAVAGTSTAAAVVAPAAPPPAPIAIPELAATADSHKEVRLNDEQRKAVLDADKARAAKHKQRAAAPSRGKHKNGPTPFHSGGSQGDPLNSSI